MPAQITLSQAFLDDFQQSEETAITNLADITTVEMKHLAPFAQPSQYPGGYSGSPGTLVKSIQRRGRGMNVTITAGVSYAIRRNFENMLNPQTKHYIERSIANVLNGKQSQWWQAERWG